MGKRSSKCGSTTRFHISGEAYFDLAKNQSLTFVDQQVSGGPIQSDTGDFLVKKGVNLVFAYGMWVSHSQIHGVSLILTLCRTEIGVGTMIVPSMCYGPNVFIKNDWLGNHTEKVRKEGWPWMKVRTITSISGGKKTIFCFVRSLLTPNLSFFQSQTRTTSITWSTK